MKRRTFLLSAAAWIPVHAATRRIRLSIGNYGMQDLAVDRALALIRSIGYDGAELCCLPNWPSEPKKLDAAARRRIRESAFPIATLLEGFNLLGSPEQRRAIPDRIRAAAELAHDVSPSNPPILQTVLGGKPGDWPAKKEVMVSRLAEWAQVAGENKIRLAVKAHAMSAIDTPEKLAWLLGKVKHSSLSADYDYSHFELAGADLEKSMDLLLPRSSFLTVKDARLIAGKPHFLLPGDGDIDYTRYFRKVKEMHWHGWVLVEVSRQLQTQPGYDPATAARRSYRYLSSILQKLDLRP